MGQLSADWSTKLEILTRDGETRERVERERFIESLQAQGRRSTYSSETPTETAPSATKYRPRRKKPSAQEVRKRAIIFGAFQCDLKGLKYCRELDKRKLPVPAPWKEEGCPSTYEEAYRANGQVWQKRIQDEKSRYYTKFNELSPNEREKLIEQTPLTRRTRQ
jgi:hypothetical protein